MFALPSQPTAGVFASKEAGFELTSPAKSRKNARNFTNRMAHCCNVHTKSPRDRSACPPRLVPGCSPSPKLITGGKTLHAAYPCTERLTSCSLGGGVGLELQEEAGYKPTAQLRWLDSSCSRPKTRHSFSLVDSLVGSPFRA